MTPLAYSSSMRPINRLSFVQKFLLILCLFVLVLSIVSYQTLKSQNEQINLATLELEGNIYEKSLYKLLQNISEEKWLTFAYLSGDKKSQKNLNALTNEINQDFNHLLAIEKNLQIDLDIIATDSTSAADSRLNKIFEKWNELNKQLTTLSANENNKFFDQLIESIQSLIIHVAEASKILIDPGLEVNYLIKASLHDLLISQEYLPLITISGYKVIAGIGDSKENKAVLIGELAILKANLRNIKKSYQRGFQAKNLTHDDLDSEGQLKDPLYRYIDDLYVFVNFVQDKILTTEKPLTSANDFFDLSNKTFEATFKLWYSTVNQMDEIFKIRLADLKKEHLFTLIILSVGLLLALFLSISLIKQIMHPINLLTSSLNKFGEGDLSEQTAVLSDDELGQLSLAYNHMAENHKNLISKLLNTMTSLKLSTQEIEASALQQVVNIEQQEESTKKIALTAHDISLTTKEFSRTMAHVSHTAEETANLAVSGKKALSQMEAIMHQMMEASQNIAVKLSFLNEKTGHITGVITTITKVADQTNLLSLNAAIEAEKAGEHGKTFAVIAKEIRRLSDQTGNATLDIEKVVTEMVSAVTAGVMSVDKFSEEIHSGVSQVTIVSENLTKIIEQVQQQTISLESVNKETQTQSNDAEKIYDSITQLNQIVQEAGVLIRKFHSSIGMLEKNSDKVQETLSKWHL